MDDTPYGGAVLTDDDGAPCLVLHGTLGPDTAVDLHEAATELVARATNATVCCTFLAGLDLAALQLLLALHAAQAEHGRHITLVDVSDPVQQILAYTGLGAILRAEPR